MSSVKMSEVAVRVPPQIVHGGRALVLKIVERVAQRLPDTLRIESIEITPSPPSNAHAPYPIRVLGDFGCCAQRATRMRMDACDSDGQAVARGAIECATPCSSEDNARHRCPRIARGASWGEGAESETDSADEADKSWRATCRSTEANHPSQ